MTGFVLQGHIFRLGRVRDCESVSPALVQMKETTGALERKQPDDP